MKTPTAHPIPRRLPGDRELLRLRAELPAVKTPLPHFTGAAPAHDFLVPNPRPDLTLDPHVLRMIEAP